MKTALTLLLAGLLSSPGAFACPFPRARQENTQDRDVPESGLASFDAVWEIINTQHFDPGFNGVDWVAVKQRLRPRVEAAEDMAAVRQVIREMLATLQQSHFALIERSLLAEGAKSAAASPAGTAGFDIRIRDGDALVSLVELGGPADVAGIRTGWILLAIDGVVLEELVDPVPAHETLRMSTVMRKRVLSRIDGEVASRARFTLRTGVGEATEVLELTRVERDATPFDLPGLPTFYLTLRAGRIEFEGLTIGVVWFSNWFRGIAGELDDTLFSMRDCDGIVLDLRGNSGGAGVMASKVAGHFFDEPTSLGKQLRRQRDQEYSVLPRRVHAGKTVNAFLGPVVILTDETTGSCSEVFAGGMQALGRARVIGERSAGATLPSTLTELPNGDYLQHAIAFFVTPRGESLEGEGVSPDQVVILDREALLAGRDEVLKAATDWIESR